MVTKAKADKNGKIPETIAVKIRKRKERNENRGNVNPADWETVDWHLVIRLIATVARIGGTTTFGYTRDGGAFYISYYIDGENIRQYIRPTEDVDQALVDEIEFWSVE